MSMKGGLPGDVLEALGRLLDQERAGNRVSSRAAPSAGARTSRCGDGPSRWRRKSKKRQHSCSAAARAATAAARSAGRGSRLPSGIAVRSAPPTVVHNSADRSPRLVHVSEQATGADRHRSPFSSGTGQLRVSTTSTGPDVVGLRKPHSLERSGRNGPAARQGAAASVVLCCPAGNREVAPA